jgi:hypothetical protein
MTTCLINSWASVRLAVALVAGLAGLSLRRVAGQLVQGKEMMAYSFELALAWLALFEERARSPELRDRFSLKSLYFLNL